MDDWKQKLFDAVTPYLEAEVGDHLRPRAVALTAWLNTCGLKKLNEISQPAQVVELMEITNRWYDEDVAKRPCAPPPPPANPFIEETVRQTIRVAKFDYFEVKGFNHQFVNLKITIGTFYPQNLRALAKQLTDLADAHEAVYPPNHCAAAC